MKTYFFFPPGRKIWLDIAVWMQAEKIAQPVFWFGDRRHESVARSNFSACYFFDGLGKLNLSVKRNKHPTCFTRDRSFLETKQICEKLMDRLDATLSFSRVEREGLFYQALLFSENCILEMKPDFAFFPEAPHSYASYLFYKLFQHHRIPILEFHSTSVAPALIPKFNGRVVTPPYAKKTAAMLAKTRQNILTLAGKMGNGQPDYMLKQAEKELSNPPAHRNSIARRAKLSIKLLFNGAIDTQAASIPLIKKAYRPLIKAERLNSLSKYLENRLSLPPRPYVYFPLHYEPERTTCPDGGKYHDQLKALFDLRASIPNDLNIVVKEHPTQLRWFMNGYRGRSVEHYRAIESIGNTILVSADLDSNMLIENSVFVASIAGTASLQCALRGKPAIIFGDAWFKGAPNVFDFSEISNHSQLSTHSSEEVQRSLENFIELKTICGLHNPSGENGWESIVNDTEFISIEWQSMCLCVEAFIGQECR